MPLPSEQIKARLKRVVSAAKSVLSGQVGLTVGCFSVRNRIYQVDRQLLLQFPVFEEYCSRLPNEIPVGSERLHWNLAVVLSTDPQLAEFEFQYRSKILKACVQIIERYSEQVAVV